MEDEACAEIMAAAGPGFRTMPPDSRQVGCLEVSELGGASLKAGVWWLEEPFDQTTEGPARLVREVDRSRVVTIPVSAFGNV
jgi:hypothetical protein